MTENVSEKYFKGMYIYNLSRSHEFKDNATKSMINFSSGFTVNQLS